MYWIFWTVIIIQGYYNLLRKKLKCVEFFWVVKLLGSGDIYCVVIEDNTYLAMHRTVLHNKKTFPSKMPKVPWLKVTDI